MNYSNHCQLNRLIYCNDGIKCLMVVSLGETKFRVVDRALLVHYSPLIDTEIPC
jgi:hypothetical protein